MGRINLAALRVRTRAIQKYNSSRTTNKGSRNASIPNWADVVADIPPAQIMIRQQPIQHVVPQIRTRTLPGSNKTEQYLLASSTPSSHKSKSGKKSSASRLFSPVEIKYEEDELRRQFFQDHPWELARPRVVLETTGNQYANVDWSRGLKQPGIPLSGESVVQRQLHLLQTVPDMTVPQSYDIARREFYILRRAEETKRRIAIEEAEHMGADWETTGAIEWGMRIENKVVDDWAKWARENAMEMSQKNSAFGGETPAAEEEVLMENEQHENNRPDVFGQEAQRRNKYQRVASPA